MNVKKCDKCGLIYKDEIVQGRGLEVKRDGEAVDLCGGCESALEQFLCGPMLLEDLRDLRPRSLKDAQLAKELYELGFLRPSARNSQFRIDQFPPGEHEKIMTELCEEKKL